MHAACIHNVECYSSALCKPLHKLDKKCMLPHGLSGSDAGVTVKVHLADLYLHMVVVDIPSTRSANGFYLLYICTRSANGFYLLYICTRSANGFYLLYICTEDILLFINLHVHCGLTSYPLFR